MDIEFFSPRRSCKSIQVLSKNDPLKLEQFLLQNPCPFHLSIILTMYSGIRIGELCALKWEDISLSNGTIYVHKTLMRIQNNTENAGPKTNVITSIPKTERSIRVIPLPSIIITYIKKYQKSGECYLLTGNKDWMEPRACLKKYKQVLQRAEVQSFSFHSLRHTFATRCIEVGMDVKSLSEILGHSDVNITMQRYVHPTLEQKRQQIERLTFIL